MDLLPADVDIPDISLCPKLSMHPAPGVHIFRAVCMIFKGVHPECAHLYSHLSLLHNKRVHGEVPGCTIS